MNVLQKITAPHAVSLTTTQGIGTSDLYHKAHAPNSETTSQYTRQYGFCVLHLHSKKINIK
jgi:hypothetical protein